MEMTDLFKTAARQRYAIDARGVSRHPIDAQRTFSEKYDADIYVEARRPKPGPII